jgi:hypothetical protein
LLYTDDLPLTDTGKQVQKNPAESGNLFPNGCFIAGPVCFSAGG